MSDEELKGSGIQFHVKYLGSVAIEHSLKHMQREEKDYVVKECCSLVAAQFDRALVTEPSSGKINESTVRTVGVQVDLNISTDSLTTVHADVSDMERFGGLVHSHPLGLVSYGSTFQQKYFGYVAHVGDDNRRCFVFEVGDASDILGTLQNAFNILARPRVEVPKETPMEMLARTSVSIRMAPYIPGSCRPPKRANRGERSQGVLFHEHYSPIVLGEAEVHDAQSRAVLELEPEPFYHGLISRGVAESRLHSDGDFLVRQSVNSPGQVILSGRQGRMCRHILLIDTVADVVRTRERVFSSVRELITHHRSTGEPIESEDFGAALTLRSPVARPP